MRFFLLLLALALLAACGSGDGSGKEPPPEESASVLGRWEVVTITGWGKNFLPGRDLFFDFEGSSEISGIFTYLLHPIIDPDDPNMTGGLPCPLGDEVHGTWINYASDGFLELEVNSCEGCWYSCGGKVILEYEVTKTTLNMGVTATFYPGETFLVSAIR